MTAAQPTPDSTWDIRVVADKGGYRVEWWESWYVGGNLRLMSAPKYFTRWGAEHAAKRRRRHLTEMDAHRAEMRRIEGFHK